MLKFVSAYLALSYLAFSTLVAAGVLQVLAAWSSLDGFALFDYRRRPILRAAGPALFIVAYAWFFGTRRELITPGPAGTELAILFGSGVLLAVLLTLLGAASLHPYRRRLLQAAAPAPIQVRQVRLGQGLTGLLFQNPGQSRSGSGICLLPDPGAPSNQLHALAGSLAMQGCLVLVPAWEEASQRYHDVLALVPAAMAFLNRQPLVSKDSLAVGGAGLGADLALCAAAEDRQICAALLLAPLWSEEHARGNLGLLHEMTYPMALRWGLQGRRRQLLRELDSPHALTHLDGRPALVVYGDRDALVPVSDVRARLERAGPSIELRLIAGEGHLSLPASPEAGAQVAQWLSGRLAQGIGAGG